MSDNAINPQALESDLKLNDDDQEQSDDESVIEINTNYDTTTVIEDIARLKVNERNQMLNIIGNRQK